MTIQEIRQAIKKTLIGIGVYIIVSLIAGAACVAVGMPFAAGFVWTAICVAGVFYLIKTE